MKKAILLLILTWCFCTGLQAQTKDTTFKGGILSSKMSIGKNALIGTNTLFTDNIFIGQNVAIDVGYAKLNLIIGDNKHTSDKELYMVWDVDYGYLDKRFPSLYAIIRGYDIHFKDSDTPDQRKLFINFLQSLLARTIK